MAPGIYAHRLGRHYGPDNSRAALLRTLQQPVDGLETDVCLTADGDLALLHDPLLDVGTTLTGWAHERRAAEISAAHLRDRDGRVSAQRPLLLEELLGVVPSEMTLQLEVKAHADPERARRTARAICERVGDPDRIEVISFWTEACEEAASRGFRSRLIIIAAYAIPALAAWGRRTGVHGVCVEHFLATPRLVSTLRAAGLSVTTGTVNHAEELAPLVPLDLDAVTSDSPHELLAGMQSLSAAA